MAFYLRNWFRMQGRRYVYGLVALCQSRALYWNLKGRMRKVGLVAFISGILALFFVISAFGLFGTSKSRLYEARPKVARNPKESMLDLHDKMASNDIECSHEAKLFSLVRMSNLFEKCAKSPLSREVEMDSYLDAWEELIRFLNSLGTAFQFVSSDVVDKVGILREFRNSSSKDGYLTIEHMIRYERDNTLINFKEEPSKKVKAYGCRTLLRLHRALKFLLILIGKLARNEDDGKVSVMGYNAYYASPMSQYHPWYVRKAVGFAVYMLPDRATLIKRMCQDLSDDELIKTMQVCSESMDSVYEHTNSLYSKYDIMELP